MKLKKYKRKRIIPVGWKEVKLGDIFRTSSGATPLSTKRSFYDGGTIPWINSGELASPYIYKASNYISQKGFENSSTEIYPKDTVLVAMYGATAGKASLLKMEACTNQAICAILPNKDYCPEFIKYNLDTLYDHLVGLSSGSARDNLSQAGLKELKLTLPSTKKEQENLVSILSLLDRKIELNKQINDNLEAMAKQLYDYWFVQFDFPNEEGKPYKSSGGAMVWNEKLKHQIPEGWEVKQLRDIIETNRGISYNTSSISGGGVPMINLASFNVDGSYKDAGLKSYNGNYTQEKILKPFDLVLCNTQQTAIEFSKDIIGKAFLIPDIFDGDIVSSHHINTIKTEEVLKPYLAYLSNTYHFHKYATGCCSGTNILGLDYNSFSQYKLEIPPKYLLKEFHDFIIDIVKRKSLIIKENKLLTKQRNEFLPLLMNGQATVNYHLSAKTEITFERYDGRRNRFFPILITISTTNIVLLA